MADTYDIALVRVDNRLVHGQILEAWVPFVKAKCIFVVDDHAASDFFCETVIRMAVPSEIEVIYCLLKFLPDNMLTSGKAAKELSYCSAILPMPAEHINWGFILIN